MKKRLRPRKLVIVIMHNNRTIIQHFPRHELIRTSGLDSSVVASHRRDGSIVLLQANGRMSPVGRMTQND